MAIGAFDYSELVRKGSLSQTGQVSGYKITENLSIPRDLPSYANDLAYEIKHAHFTFNFKNPSMQYLVQHHWFCNSSFLDRALTTLAIIIIVFIAILILTGILTLFTNCEFTSRMDNAVMVIAVTVGLTYFAGCTLTSNAQHLSNEQAITDDIRLCQLEGHIYQVGSKSNILSEVFDMSKHYYLLFTNGDIDQIDFNNATIGKNNVLIDLTNNKTYTGESAYRTLLKNDYIVSNDSGDHLADYSKVNAKQVKDLIVEKVSDADD